MSEKRKDNIKYLLGILIPTIITFSLYFFTAKSISLIIKILLFVLITLACVLVVIYRLSEFLDEIKWKKEHKKILNDSIIAIIKEDGCKLEKTKFTPEEWRNLLKTNYTIRHINISQISNDYVAIINPYGEFYPEENLLYKTTFDKIKKYVMNGGIFVSVAGCAFWYAWNRDTKRHPSTAKESYFYQGEMNQNKQIFLQPSFSTLPLNSLTETLTNDKFGMLTTGFRYPVRTRVKQEPEDIQVCGDIKKIGTTDEIFEFRAIREPSQDFVPMLRADVPTPQRPIKVFPLAYIPDKKGKFIFTGMHMNMKRNDEILLPTGRLIKTRMSQQRIDGILEAQAKKVCKALENIIEIEKDELL